MQAIIYKIKETTNFTINDMQNIERLYIVQQNSSVLGIQENYERILYNYKEAIRKQSDLLILSRFAFSGPIINYETLIADIVEFCNHYLSLLVKKTHNKKTGIILGTTIFRDSVLYEAIYLIENGTIKELLSFGINDYFNKVTKFIFKETKISLITELKNIKKHLSDNEEIILAMDCLTYKDRVTVTTDEHYVSLKNKLLIFMNCTGLCNEDLLYGQSYVVYNNQAISLLPLTEDQIFIELSRIKNNSSANIKYIPSDYEALIYSLRYYTNKHKFTRVLLGLSGGVDSALTAAIASDALGANNVSTFMLSTRYTSQSSFVDAKECADNIGIAHQTINIDPIFSHIAKETQIIFQEENHDITNQNIQSRIRGLILMAISNQNSQLLLATGNKSELSVGYATIYGDMCGGFAPIKYAYKTKVYELARWRNNHIPKNSLCKKTHIIPKNILDKDPSAELIYNQKDQDTLPQYTTLDKILELLIDEKRPISYLVNKGYDKELINNVVHLIKKSEFKRKQAPTGIKI